MAGSPAQYILRRGEGVDRQKSWAPYSDVEERVLGIKKKKSDDWNRSAEDRTYSVSHAR